MPMIAGLFRSADAAVRALGKINFGAAGLAAGDIHVAGRDLAGLEQYQHERAYKHERTAQTGWVLLVIRSDSADLVALRGQLEAAGMETLVTEYHNPRSYSRYPFGDGVNPQSEQHPREMESSIKAFPEKTASRSALKRTAHE